MSKTDPYSLRHQAQRSAYDADQAEFLALRNGDAVLDSGVYDERVAGAMDDFESSDVTVGTNWHGEDLKYDTAVGKIHEEIERRQALLGTKYPFSLRGGTISHEPRENVIYEFLLAICNSPTLTSGQHVGLPRVFERISARLVASYFGSGTQFIHTGAPRDEEIGKPFEEAMKTVANRTSEWSWGPDDGLPNEPSNGDSGCDFVVWPAPPDGRKIGQLFVLGQCACGNDWTTKFTDLTMNKLSKWFNPLSLVDPVRCFSTPFHVVDAMLKEASREGGVVFDRARLVSISYMASEEIIEEALLEKVTHLTELVKG